MSLIMLEYDHLESIMYLTLFKKIKLSPESPALFVY